MGVTQRWLSTRSKSLFVVSDLGSSICGGTRRSGRLCVQPERAISNAFESAAGEYESADRSLPDFCHAFCTASAALMASWIAGWLQGLSSFPSHGPASCCGSSA